MPTTTEHGLVKPLGAEPAWGPGAIGDLADSVDAAYGIWADYTPTLTGPTVSTTVYRYAVVGDVIHVRFAIKTTAGGSGTWSLTLPELPVVDATFRRSVGNAMYHVASSGSMVHYIAVIDVSGTVVKFVSPSAPTAFISGAGVLNDTLAGAITYERA